MRPEASARWRNLLCCRSTLTDPALVKLLYDNNVAVWGGDVRDTEAWSGTLFPVILSSLKLTYP